MDAETYVSVGSYCENLLQDPTFQFLSGYFEQNAIGELLATKPHETRLRETIYGRVSAHRDFLSLLHDFIQKKHAAEVQPKDHLDEIDDPAVHNIHEGFID